jgi:dipeptidase E
MCSQERPDADVAEAIRAGLACFSATTRRAVKLLLTSSGISNQSINSVLVDLLGKPIAESTALIVPTGIYPFPNGAYRAWGAVSGRAKSPFAELGWRSLGVLELTALTSVRQESWVPMLQEADVLYVWGGHVLYLSYWMKQSGLAGLLPSLSELVYVGCSAGSIVTTPYNCDAESNLQVVPSGHEMALEGDKALGLVDFAVTVHLDNPDPIFEDHSLANVEKWAAGIPVPTYAIDDETAIKVTDGSIDVVSEGHWKLIPPKNAPG